MDVGDPLSTFIVEEKTCDEITVFEINENGSVTKRRRRKSLGRRVSFAEAPKLHIFPRDDEYETPTRGTSNADRSPSKGGQRRSPRLAAKVVDSDKENRVLASKGGSNRGRRNGAKKPLAARGEGSPALKPHNWLDERDSSSLAGNDEENTGPVDLRHLSFHQKDSEMDEDNLTLDSTTFALKFALQQSRNGEAAVVPPVQSISAVVDAFAVDDSVLESDMSFTISRPLLRSKAISESHKGVVEVSSDMSLTLQVPKEQRKAHILAIENISFLEDSIILSDHRIPTPRNSSLSASRNDIGLVIISSDDGENGPAPVPVSLEVRAQIEARFGTGFVDDEIDATVGSEGNVDTAGSDMCISPLSVASMAHEDRTITISMSQLRHLIRDEEDKKISVSVPSPDQEDRSICLGTPSLQHLIREEEDEEFRMAGMAVDVALREREGLNPTEDAELMLTQAEFTGMDSPPKNAKKRSTSVDLTDLKMVRGTKNPTEDAQMMLAEAEIAGSNSPPKNVEVKSTDMSLLQSQRVRETFSPIEDGQMMLATADFAGMDSPPKNANKRSMNMDLTDWKMVGEMRNPTEDAQMMLAEAEFAGSSSPPKNVKAKCTDRSLLQSQRVRETLTPTEDEQMLATAEFTKADSPLKDVDVGKPYLGLAELQREILHPAEEAEMMLTEAEFTGAYSPSEDVEIKPAALEVHSRPQAELDLTDMQRADQMCGPPLLAEMSVPEIEIRERREKRNVQINADIKVNFVSRESESQEGKDDHSSPVIATTTMRDVVSRITPGAEELHSSVDAADDPEVRQPDEVISGKEKAKEMSSPSQDANLGVAAVGTAASQVEQEPRSPTRKVGRRMPIVSFQGPQEAGKWASPETTRSNVSPRQNFDNRATKRTKFLGDTSSKAVKESDNLEGSTASVPLFSDLLEVDMKSADSTPARPLSRSMWMTPPSSVAAARAHESDVINSSPENEDEDSAHLTSPTDSSMDIVDPIPHSLHKSPIQPTEESPCAPDWQAPESFAALDTRMNLIHCFSPSDMEEIKQSTLANQRRRITAQEIKTSQSDPVEDTSGVMESTDHINILSAPHEKEVGSGSLSNRRQLVATKVMEPQKNDDYQESLSTKEMEDRTHTLSVDRPEEKGQGILMSRNQSSQSLESLEKVNVHYDNPLRKETVDISQVLGKSLAEEQSTSSSPRPTVPPQLIRATNLDKVHEMSSVHKPDVGSKLGDEYPAHVFDRIQERGGEIINVMKMPVKEFLQHADENPARVYDRIQERGGEIINVTKMPVEEFLQHAEVHFSHGLQNPMEVLKDPSLAETYDMRSLSESLTYVGLVKPQLDVMRYICEMLYEKVDLQATAVSKLEEQLTASNPAIFSYFEKAPELKKLRLRTHLRRIQGNYRSRAEKNRINFQQILETEYRSSLLGMKNDLMFYADHVQGLRNTFDEKAHRPLLRLRANVSSRDANQECTSTLRATVDLERIEDLRERQKDLNASRELKLVKLLARKQVAVDTLTALRKNQELAKTSLSKLRCQVVDNVCSGKKNLVREEVALTPYLYVKKMRAEVCLLHRLQEGFQVRSAGRENQHPILELSYRSLVKRRYVVRKDGTSVKVLASSWAYEQEKIEEMFPGVNALLVFSFALTTTRHAHISQATGTNAIALTQMFGRLSTLEAVRFMLPSAKLWGIPEPTDLRASMQVTRSLVGNLMELMEEVSTCQSVVNESAGGGILAEPVFRNLPDGVLQLELKFIDCISSVKFFVNLDMSCVLLNGYPLGNLPAKVEMAYCAPKARHRFKREALESSLSLVKPGYQRLVRTYAAVGAFLGSLRSGL